MTYNNYYSIVPNDTKGYLDSVFTIVDDAAMEEFVSNNYGSSYVNTDDEVFLSMLYHLKKDSRYSSLISKTGIDLDINIYYSKKGLIESDYCKYSKYIDLVDKEYYCYCLTPLMIFNNLIKSNKSNYKEIYNMLGGIKITYEDFVSLIESEALKELKMVGKSKFEKYLSDKSNNIISYLDMVGKTYMYLDNNSLNLSNNDLYAYSYLIALFLYKDVNTDFNEKNILDSELKRIDLTLEKIEKSLNMKINIDELMKYDSSFVQYKFTTDAKKYVGSILSTALNNYYTSVVKILNDCNVDDDEFKNMLNSAKSERSNVVTKNEFDSFYYNISSEYLEYINLCGKIYKYIKSTYFDSKKINDIFIVNDSDLISLSLLLGAYNSNDILIRYFNHLGITPQYIEEILGIKLDMNKINEMQVDKAFIVSKYKKIGNKLIHDALTSGNYYTGLYNKILAYKTDVTIKDRDDSFAHAERYAREEEEKRKAKLTQEIFNGMNPKIYNFCVLVSNYYKQLNNLKSINSENERQTYAILYSLLHYDSFYHYLEIHDINTRYLNNTVNSVIKSVTKDAKINIDIINDHFTKLIFEGINKDKKKEDITIGDIVENVFSGEKDIHIDRFLYDIKESRDLFVNFEAKAKKHKENAEKNRAENRYSEEVRKYNKDIVDMINMASKVHVYLSDKNIKYDEIDTSVLISYLLTNDKNKVFLEKQGVTLDNVLHALKIDDNNVIENINKCEIDIDFATDLLSVQFNSLSNSIDKNNLSVYNFMNYVIKFDFELIEDIADDYSTLKYEFANQKEKERVYTKEEIINELSSLKTPQLDTGNISALITYGDELTKHITIINNEYKSLVTNDNTNTTLSDIGSLVPSIYEVKEAVIKEPTFFQKLQGKKAIVIEPEKKEVNFNVLRTLKERIDENLIKLNEELVGFDYIRKYHEIYIDRLNGYIDETKKQIEKEIEFIKSLDNDDSVSKMKLLNHRTILEILRGKLNSFEASMVTRMTDLLQIHQSIVNHFVTINALKTAKDDLIPLIGSKMLISMGQNTENKSLELSQNIINLFNSVLQKNIEGTRENLEKLRQASLPKESIDKIEQDIELYINGIKSLRNSESYSEKNEKKDDESKLLLK